jgi:hypothetical protein
VEVSRAQTRGPPAGNLPSWGLACAFGVSVSIGCTGIYPSTTQSTSLPSTIEGVTTPPGGAPIRVIWIGIARHPVLVGTGFRRYRVSIRRDLR